MKPDIEEVKPNLFVKKTKKGYKVVYPIKNKDGSINWKNLLLGDTNLFWAGVILIIFILVLVYSYKHDLNAMQEMLKDPCRYCIESAKINLG